MSQEIQQNELIRLINQGFPFEIIVHKEDRKPGILGLFKKKQVTKEVRKFLIKEPTLHTLDRITLAGLSFRDDGLKNADDILDFVKQQRYYRAMAKIAAIATAQNESEEEELEELFFKTLKPSDLKTIVEMADIASNMTDFISSILSVAALKRERIEKQELPDLKPHTDLEE